LISTFVFWLPFLLRTNSWFGLSIPNSNFLYIYRHYDGPLYAVAAKTLYNPSLIEKFILDISFDVKYFSAHLPLYPLLVRLFAPIFNYSKSTIFINVSATLALAVFFYYLVKQFKLTKSPLILTFVFLMVPRFLIVRSIGAPESLFIFLILLSLFFFEKKNYLLAGLFGGLASMTKTPGVLLFVAYVLVFLEQTFRHSGEQSDSLGMNPRDESRIVVQKKLRFRTPLRSSYFVLRTSRDKSSFEGQAIRNGLQKLFVLLIPTGLLLVFYFYQVQYKDFFAYFHSGDNIHLVAPFAVFNSQSRWVGTAWLEDVIFYFFLYLLSTVTLKNSRYRSFFYFSLVFLLATSLVQHRDIGRYSLPLWPLACIALEKFFTSKKFLLTLVILLPAIYLYAWNFSLQNVMPVSDWSSFFSK